MAISAEPALLPSQQDHEEMGSLCDWPGFGS